MNKQIKLLQTHFSDAEIQTLLDIFPYLRDPSNRELGFQLLKGSNLYDSFTHFMVKYATTHQMLWKYDDGLWDYMFAQKLVLTDNHAFQTDIIFKCDEICLPLFSERLELRLNDCYRSMYLPVTENPIVISNVLDIDYPITLTYNVLNKIDMPQTVDKLYLVEVTIYRETNELFMRNFKKYPPKNIKLLNIEIPFNIEMGDSLKRFDNLELLEMSPIQWIKDMDTMSFPPNLKTLIVNCPPLLEMGKFQTMLRNCIQHCNHLTNIQVHGDYCDKSKCSKWVRILESNSYKAMDGCEEGNGWDYVKQ